jgi:hypothetical protein
MAAWKGTCVPRKVVWIKLVVENYFEDPCLVHSFFSCDIGCASPRPSFHSCNCGIFIVWCPHSAWATRIYNCLMPYTSKSGRRRLSDWNRLASGRRLPENVLVVHGAVCVVCIFSEYTIITEPCSELCILSAHNSEFFLLTFTIAKKCVTCFDSDVHLQKWTYLNSGLQHFRLTFYSLCWGCTWICF